jgi:hypothetical protein
MSYLVEFHLGPEPSHPEWTHFATRVDLPPPPIGTSCSVITDKPLRGLTAGALVLGRVGSLEYCEGDDVMIYRVKLAREENVDIVTP